MENSKTIIIALGGSIIVPQPEKINVRFLKNFRYLILKFVKRGYRFIIIAGGGKVCRTYQEAAAKIIKASYKDQDWIGIHATRLNAHLLRTIFKREAWPVVLDYDPPSAQFKKLKKELLKKPIIIAAGWRPGWSTDYVSVLLAKRFKVKQIIDAGNIPFVYSKDLLKYKKATAIKKISWKDYRKLVGSKWIPGLSCPIDPIAAKEAQKLKIRAMVIRGTDLKNFERLLSDKKFRGTTIEP
jgi:uridylate kinase